jgi:hypothetical protein
MGHTFSERLTASLTLTLAGREHRIAPGNVRSFALELKSWGLEGQVEFVVADKEPSGGQEKDEVLADFLQPQLGKVALKLVRSLSDAPADASPTPLELEGLISERELTELPASESVKGTPVLFRHYRVRFMDPARLLWRQHFPSALYTRKSLQDVLEAHKGDHIHLTYEWSELSTSRPQLFLGLSPEQGVSLYDFVLWYVHEHGGCLSYDCASGQYRLAAEKDASAEPVELRAEEVLEQECFFPEVIRHEVQVLNSWAAGPATKPVPQEQSAPGIRQDVLVRTQVADEVEARSTREEARLVVRGPELELTWQRFPLQALAPGALVSLPAHASWAASVPAQDTWRVRHVLLHAKAQEPSPDVDHGAPHAEYEVSLHTRLERKEEAWVELPAFLPPHYPHLAEGFIVSEVGDKKHETWHTYSQEVTSLDCYQVRVPLWEGQVITVPFEPTMLAGIFYFPAYKGERVLVALHLLHSTLERFLDWRAGARLPADAQGVQLLMGKSTQSNTALRHFYEDGKPLFLLQRTHEKDTAKLQVREGGLLLQVKEEPQ